MQELFVTNIKEKKMGSTKTIHVTYDLWLKLKGLAAQQGRNLQPMVAELINKGLDNDAGSAQAPVTAGPVQAVKTESVKSDDVVVGLAGCPACGWRHPKGFRVSGCPVCHRSFCS